MLEENCDIGHNNFTREVYLTLSVEADTPEEALKQFEGAAKFGSKVDYDGKGFSIKSMQRMKMDTKDTIAPERYECKKRDYMRVGNYYARSFFINSISECVPDGMMLDIVSVSSNSIVSGHYDGVDQELGFKQAEAKIRQRSRRHLSSHFLLRVWRN